MCCGDHTHRFKKGGRANRRIWLWLQTIGIVEWGNSKKNGGSMCNLFTTRSRFQIGLALADLDLLTYRAQKQVRDEDVSKHMPVALGNHS